MDPQTQGETIEVTQGEGTRGDILGVVIGHLTKGVSPEVIREEIREIREEMSRGVTPGVTLEVEILGGTGSMTTGAPLESMVNPLHTISSNTDLTMTTGIHVIQGVGGQEVMTLEREERRVVRYPQRSGLDRSNCCVTVV